MRNNKVFCICFFVVLSVSIVSSVAFGQAQATTTGSTGLEGILRSYIVGGMLRHPDPTVRMQAIQALAQQLAGNYSNTATTGTTDTRRTTTNTSDTTGSQDASMFIPDLYVLISDPDPEVRDLASAALDIIMGTEVTILRLMSDEEPLIRNYAIKIYASRIGQQTATADDTGDTSTAAAADIYELIALRTLLVKLKHESNVEVRKTITGAIEGYLRTSGVVGEESLGVASMMKIEPEMLEYLEDEDPQTRINAIRLISGMDASYDILMMFMSKMKTEKDEDVRREMQRAIDTFIERRREVEGRGGM